MKIDKSVKEIGITTMDIVATVATLPVLILLFSAFIVFIPGVPNIHSMDMTWNGQLLIGAMIALKYSFIIVFVELLILIGFLSF